VSSCDNSVRNSDRINNTGFSRQLPEAERGMRRFLLELVQCTNKGVAFVEEKHHLNCHKNVDSLHNCIDCVSWCFAVNKEDRRKEVEMRFV
jgi:hypothetical protein